MSFSHNPTTSLQKRIHSSGSSKGSQPLSPSRIHLTRFQEHLDEPNPYPYPDPPSPPTNTRPRSFIPPPPPLPPSPSPSPRKFKRNPSPRHHRHESTSSYQLRKARLELASKLSQEAPLSPLLSRVHPKTGKVVNPDGEGGGEGFAGTGMAGYRKNPKVRKKGHAAGDDIREEEMVEDGDEGAKWERADGLGGDGFGNERGRGRERASVGLWEGRWGRRFE